MGQTRAKLAPQTPSISIFTGNHTQNAQKHGEGDREWISRGWAAVLWLIVWQGNCLSVHATEERASATILFGYLQGAEVVPLA
jgi:hypothetical protein